MTLRAASSIAARSLVEDIALVIKQHETYSCTPLGLPSRRAFPQPPTNESKLAEQLARNLLKNPVFVREDKLVSVEGAESRRW